jgi:prepilin-type processing-associated H-X9-DG protein
MITRSLPTRWATPAPAFSIMEMLVAAAVLIVITATAIPIYSGMRQRSHKQAALDRMKSLSGALLNYTSQNGGTLPEEDTDGNETWRSVARPEAKEAWYNALPRLLGRKGAGDYENSPKEFYRDDNILFLPGANYPDEKKMLNPLFAIAFNTKLERTDPTGAKQPTKMEHVTNPARTVALLEQGLLNEDRTLQVQTKNDYDGSPKGSAKSFVGRYGGQGVLAFLDGHVELAYAKDLLTETGQFPYPQASVIWTRTPEENPNKDAEATAKKKSKK